MISDRKTAFDTICRVLAITRLDIEHHQAINDQSLNIHGEDYFKDVFNFIYGYNLVNVNKTSLNEPYIDLIDKANKKLIQITTTRTKEKILHTLKVFLDKKYKGYDISIYYLLDKAKPNKSTITEVELAHPVKLVNVLKDYENLVRDINALETNRLIELANTYFLSKEKKYTDEIVLDLVFKKLLKDKATLITSYDDNLSSIEVNEKIKVNNINERITNKIVGCLDYTCIVDAIDEGELSTDLRELVVNKLYKVLLVEQLKSKEKKSILVKKNVVDLQNMAVSERIDFSKMITLLSQKLESLIMVKDFNSMNISWILVAYFFEICDVGVQAK